MDTRRPEGVIDVVRCRRMKGAGRAQGSWRVRRAVLSFSDVDRLPSMLLRCGSFLLAMFCTACQTSPADRVISQLRRPIRFHVFDSEFEYNATVTSLIVLAANAPLKSGDQYLLAGEYSFGDFQHGTVLLTIGVGAETPAYTTRHSSQSGPFAFLITNSGEHCVVIHLFTTSDELGRVDLGSCSLLMDEE